MNTNELATMPSLLTSTASLSGVGPSSCTQAGSAESFSRSGAGGVPTNETMPLIDPAVAASTFLPGAVVGAGADAGCDLPHAEARDATDTRTTRTTRAERRFRIDMDEMEAIRGWMPMRCTTERDRLRREKMAA